MVFGTHDRTHAQCVLTRRHTCTHTCTHPYTECTVRKCISCIYTLHTRFELTKREHLPVLISFGFWQVAVCQFSSRIKTSGNSMAMEIFIIFSLYFIYLWFSIESVHQRASEYEKCCEWNDEEQKKRTNERNKMFWRLMSYINCRILLSFIKCEDTKTYDQVERQSNGWSAEKNRSRRRRNIKNAQSEKCWIEAFQSCSYNCQKRNNSGSGSSGFVSLFLSLTVHLSLSHRSNVSIRCNRFTLIRFFFWNTISYLHFLIKGL